MPGSSLADLINTNNLSTAQCIHASKHHILPHKYVKLSYVNKIF
jgi:hypothetical protein